MFLLVVRIYLHDYFHDLRAIKLRVKSTISSGGGRRAGYLFSLNKHICLYQNLGRGQINSLMSTILFFYINKLSIQDQ